MIQECRVLLRIQHLEQGTSGVTVVSATNLVNLINEYQRILGAHALECLDDLSWQSAAMKASVFAVSTSWGRMRLTQRMSFCGP